MDVIDHEADLIEAASDALDLVIVVGEHDRVLLELDHGVLKRGRHDVIAIAILRCGASACQASSGMGSSRASADIACSPFSRSASISLAHYPRCRPRP